MRVLAALLSLTCALAAQVIRVENVGDDAFHGWKRVTTDTEPQHPACSLDGTLFVKGRQSGLDAWIVDVKVVLGAGESRVFNLTDASPVSWRIEPFPTLEELIQKFGGPIRLNGQEMLFTGLPVKDGAAYVSRMRLRTGPLVCGELWTTWYPDQSGWMQGELRLAASNPTNTVMAETLSASYALTFGDAFVFTLGTPAFGAGLFQQDTSFADGQARILPVTFLWPRGLTKPSDFSTAAAVIKDTIGGVGVQRLLPNGNPRYPPSFEARPWTTSLLTPSRQKLHSWDAAMLGPNKASGDTGEQEDQVFVRGEALLPRGVFAEHIAYLAALKLANRPCHHLEADGSLLDWTGHLQPRLVLWDGRPHWHSGVSPDRLGKTAGLTTAQAAGWWGPDVEHALFNTLYGATRLTGSLALQDELSMVARIYLFQWTVAPGLSTSQPYAARAVGWEGILATHLWIGLEDRVLAEAVRARWRARFDAFAWMMPNLDIRTDDPRLGPGQRWMPWQEAVKCYGLDFAGEYLGRPQARVIALAHAKRILDQAYVNIGALSLTDVQDEPKRIPEGVTLLNEVRRVGNVEDSLPNIYGVMQATLEGQLQSQSATGVDIPAVVWVTKDVVAVDGAQVTMGYFDLFGMPLAPAVVLRHEPNHPVAISIWDYNVTRQTLVKHMRWVAPGVR